MWERGGVGSVGEGRGRECGREEWSGGVGERSGLGVWEGGGIGGVGERRGRGCGRGGAGVVGERRGRGCEREEG